MNKERCKHRKVNGIEKQRVKDVERRSRVTWSGLYTKMEGKTGKGKTDHLVEDRRQKRGEHLRLCLEENIIAAHAHIER